jgi:singapore isolate B (sub-type 7) whole genome shotgun sequence assembly, scaffold_10
VWGRGTRSGGGWHTVDDLATLAQFGVSAAIFAPGWILEQECGGVSDDAYREKERDFWNRRVASVSSEGRVCWSFAEGSVSGIVVLIGGYE